ncbi:hypothetical protein B0H67DRAFT_567529 [Lasiosphaeris hirsuta]|uniref:Ankyrin repeat domain-containing protein n=1 Tax=Lasiosphaeris hirsuta TaxID=260670 RepID=A0AA40AYF0_9PEZI|nr:hypothetical protein B0H67DRAFT_567529 [Lasiosphaeris hirsuta]
MPRPGDGQAVAVASLMKILLDRGADPNLRNGKNETPLLAMLAVQPQVPDTTEVVIRTLLSCGANPWCLDDFGRCPVFEVAKQFPKTSRRFGR